MQCELSEYYAKWAFRIYFSCIAVWLVASLFWVNIDFVDAYGAIANAQYLVGASSDYFWQRGPGMAVLLVPAEWVAENLRLHPLDVRPHHATMVLLHLSFLWLTWRELKLIFGARVASLVAFIAAVPNFVFFSYAPFISHDLFPGLIALAMIRIVLDYIRHASLRSLLGLVLLGVLAACVKQTFILFWPVVLVSVWIATRERGKSLYSQWRSFSILIIGAIISGALCWIAYSLVLESSFPGVSFWLRPWAQAVATANFVTNSGSARESFDQLLYFRNLSAYGILAMALVVPGLVLSLRHRDPMVKAVAVSWILFFALMQLIQFKEVRYLAILAPLTAVVVVPAIDALVKIRASYIAVLAFIWLFDLRAIVVEATRLHDPFYSSLITGFMRSLPTEPVELRAPVLISSPLSFVSPEPYAFRRDRYHRVTSLIADQIRILYHYPKNMVQGLESQTSLNAPYIASGTILIIANDMATRLPPFRADNLPWQRDGYSQLLAVAEVVHLDLTDSGYRLRELDQRPVMLFPIAGVAAQPLTSADYFEEGSIKNLRNLNSTPPELEILGFRIREYCDQTGCRSL